MLNAWPKALVPFITFLMGASLALAVSGHAKSPEPAPRVTPKAEIPRLVSPNGAATIDLLGQGNNAFFGVLRMKGKGKVPKHRDATEEYIYVVEGGGTITIDGVNYPVRSGTAIFMPAGAEVSFRGGPEPLVAIQVFAGPGPAAKYRSWKSIKKTQ